MDNEISMEQRLSRIEQLLAGQKNVLTFDEACTFTGISGRTCTNSLAGAAYRITSPAAKTSISTAPNWSADFSATRIKTADEMEQEAANYVINPRSSS